jgi:hypothetical protein
MELSPSNDVVEQRAYELWEVEGCPEGRELEFWLKAEQGLSEKSSKTSSGIPPLDREGEPPG